jgi:hypothetical protein
MAKSEITRYMWTVKARNTRNNEEVILTGTGTEAGSVMGKVRKLLREQWKLKDSKEVEIYHIERGAVIQF